MLIPTRSVQASSTKLLINIRSAIEVSNSPVPAWIGIARAQTLRPSLLAGLAFYVKDDAILAVAGIGRDRDIAAISELMRMAKMPKAYELQQTDIDWVKRLAA